MSAQCFVDSVRLSSSSGFGTIVKRTGYGFKPKFVMIWSSGFSDADEVVATNAAMHVGIATDNGRVATGSTSVNAGANSDTYCAQREDCCFLAVSGAGAVTTTLEVASFDADGVTLVHTPTGSAIGSWRIHILALGGDDITDIGTTSFSPNTTTFDVDSFGFQPDCVFLLSISAGSFPALPNGCRFSLGVVDTALNNAVISGSSEDAAATMNTKAYCRSGDSVAIWNTTAGLTTYGGVTAWRSNGFRMSFPALGSVARVTAVAIKGLRCALKTGLTQINTTTDIAITGAGFAPIGGLVAGASRVADAAGTPTNHAMVSVGAFNSATSEKAAASWDENATANAECAIGNEFDACLINISALNALQGAMHVQSMDADGVTFRMATADAAQNFFWTLLFGSETQTRRSRDFDGAVSVTKTDPAGVTLNAAWTFGAWVNPDVEGPVNARSILKLGGATTGFDFYVNSTGVLRYRDANAAIHDTSTSDLGTGVWRRVGLVKAGVGVSNITVVMDGTGTAQNMDVPPALAAGDVFKLAHLDGGVGIDPIDGKMAWAFWLQGVALTTAQIDSYLNNPESLLNDYGPGGNITPDALRVFWTMHCDNGLTEVDRSEWDNHGTYSSTATKLLRTGPSLTTPWANACNLPPLSDRHKQLAPQRYR